MWKAVTVTYYLGSEYLIKAVLYVMITDIS